MGKVLIAEDIHKEMFPVCGGKCSSHKGGGKPFAADEEIEMAVRKWLRQQSKDFYATEFDALVKRWDKCMNVGGEYVER
jgi:hypothetical protein